MLPGMSRVTANSRQLLQRQSIPSVHRFKSSVPLYKDLQHVRILSSDTSMQAGGIPNFDDSTSGYGSKSMPELLRAYGVFRLSSFQPLVRNSGKLYDTFRPLAPTLVDSIVKASFFGHFCGGETTSQLKPCIEMLNASGINGILDYAAENAPDDVDPEVTMQEDENQPARTYDYVSEKQCDHHVEVFKNCVMAVKDVSPRGFAALKLTALGNPALLERLSNAILETRRLFENFDVDGDGVVTVEEFKQTYTEMFIDADTKLPELLPRLDPNSTGVVDYVEWSTLLQPRDLPRLVAGCREVGPLSKACPTEEELGLMEAMKGRLWEIATLASDNKVRLLIDAEQTYYQPAIDNYVLSLQKQFNAAKDYDEPIIFNTYQCYLKDAKDRVATDLDRAHRGGYHFAAKFVRGAYMIAERERAEALGYESPIHDTLEDTHRCYNETAEMALRDRAEKGTKGEIMIASHNRQSVEQIIERMIELDIKPDSGALHFAQLLGMRDDLSFSLGKAGYNAYKYVPYGLVSEVMPYLIRRAQENSDITKGMGEELQMIGQEIRRRVGIA